MDGYSHLQKTLKAGKILPVSGRLFRHYLYGVI